MTMSTCFRRSSALVSGVLLAALAMAQTEGGKPMPSMSAPVYGIVVGVATPAQGGAVLGGGPCPVGSKTTLTAISSNGFVFAKWQDGQTVPSRAVTVVAGTNRFTASFVPAVTVTAAAVPPVGGRVANTPVPLEGGLLAAGVKYPSNTTVTLSATASNKWRLVKWSDGNATATRSFPNLRSNVTLTACFTQVWTIAGAVSPAGAGTVKLSGSGTYDDGATVSLNATVNTGWKFKQWADGELATARQVVATSSMIYTAVYAQVVSITATPSPAKGGAVTGGGAYEVGTPVPVTATPSNGWRFAHWQDGVTLAARTVTVAKVASVLTATFVQQGTLVVLAQPADAGSVTGAGTFDVGLSKILTASANPGWMFTQWQNSTVTTTARTVAVTANTTTNTAVFARAVTIAGVADPSYAGTATGGATVPAGKNTVTLVAHANAGWRFTEWSDGVATATHPPLVNSIGSKTYSAEFTLAAGVLSTELNGRDVTSLPPFGDIVLGSAVTQQVEVVNTGVAALHVTSIKTPTGFSVDKPVFTLAVNATNVLTVVFHPTVAGATTRTTALVFVSDTATGMGNSTLYVQGSGNPDAQGTWRGVWPGASAPFGTNFTLCLQNVSYPSPEGPPMNGLNGKVFGRDATGAYQDGSLSGSPIFLGNQFECDVYTGESIFGTLTGTVSVAGAVTTIRGAFQPYDMPRPLLASLSYAIPPPQTFTLTQTSKTPYVDLSGTWTNTLNPKGGDEMVQIRQTADQFIVKSFGTEPMEGAWVSYGAGWITDFNAFAACDYTSDGLPDANDMTSGTFDGLDTIRGQVPDGMGGMNPFILLRLSTTAPTFTMPSFPAADGLLALGAFFNPGDGMSPDTGLVAQAAADFAAVAKASPANCPNHIFNALSILLSLINDPALRAQAQACGVDLTTDFWHPTALFPTNGAPCVNDTIDALANSALPAIDKALAELAAVPANWGGTAVVTTAELAIDETTYIDLGDVTAMKAGLNGLRAWIGVLKAYDLNANICRLKDPVPTPVTSIEVNGLTADWAGVPVSLAYYGDGVLATQELSVALDGQHVAILMKGTAPVADASWFSFSCQLYLSNGSSINGCSHLDVYVDGSFGSVNDVYAYLNSDNLTFDSSNAAVLNGVLEIKLPPLGDDSVTQVTIAHASFSMTDDLVVPTDAGFSVSTPGDVPIAQLRQAQSNVLSRVRNQPSLTKAQSDLSAALAFYVTTDSLIAARKGPTTNLTHLVDYDPNDPEAVKKEGIHLQVIKQLQSGLAGNTLTLDTDASISATGTESVHPLALFTSPITTSKLPTGLRGTLNNPRWDSFPDAKFNGLLPTMTSDNLNKYLLGFPSVSVETIRDFTAGASAPYQLGFDAEMQGGKQTITDVTVSGPGIGATKLVDTWDDGDWNTDGGNCPVSSALAVGTRYSFAVAFADGSQQTVSAPIQTWIAADPKPTMSGSVLKWSNIGGSVPKAHCYYVTGEGVGWMQLPLTQTSLDLAPFGWKSGSKWSIEVGIVNENWDKACHTIVTL